MNQKLTITKLTLLLCLILAAGWMTGCQQQTGNNDMTAPATEVSAGESKVKAYKPNYLTITGDGVEQPCSFSIDELKAMNEASSSECYSAVNNWPIKKFYVGKGVRVAELLSQAGFKRNAQTIIVRSADGYNITLTREQLEEKRYCFPRLMEGSEKEAREVPVILAWEYQEGTSDLTKAVSGQLSLFIGQIGLNDVTSAAFVKDVVAIEVLCSDPGQWQAVQAEPGKKIVKAGTEVLLMHPEQDRVKIYYTLDGSRPTVHSLLYNPSTSYYQPDLARPVQLDESTTIKAIAIGMGKKNSAVATFKYQLE